MGGTGAPEGIRTPNLLIRSIKKAHFTSIVTGLTVLDRPCYTFIVTLRLRQSTTTRSGRWIRGNMAVSRRKDGTYHAQYYVDGERFTVPGSFRTKAQARRAAEHAKAGHAFRPRPKKGADSLLFGVAAAQMIRELQVLENTRNSYESTLRCHVLPVLKDVRVEDITRGMLKRMFIAMEEDGKSKAVIKHAKVVISNTLQMLVEDDRLPANLARGIDLGEAPLPEIKIEDMEVIQRILSRMPTDGARLWMFIQIGTGCRPNEIRALRPCDLVDRELSIAWVVNETKSWKKRGLPHFIRRAGTKNGHTRKISASLQLKAAWVDYVKKHGIGPEEPLFIQERVVPPFRPRNVEDIEIPSDLGTVDSASGRQYRHGTVGAYVTAKCRCDWCRVALRQDRRRNRSYKRRHAGARPPWRDPKEYVTESQWRTIWNRAWSTEDTNGERPTAYQMRHTHASWLIDQGQPPVKVMQRLGHRDLAVTQRYVHPVNDDQELADAFDSLTTWLDDSTGSPEDTGVVDLRSRHSTDEELKKLDHSGDRVGSQHEGGAA